MSIKKLLALAGTVAFVATAGPAQADIKVGVVLALTGPNASLGVPYRKGVELFPKEIGGEKVQMIFLDDASDPSTAVKNARKLAIDNAKVQAAEIAEAAGVTLGSIITVNINNLNTSTPMYDRVAAQGGSEVPISAGQLAITVEASVTYEIQ